MIDIMLIVLLLVFVVPEVLPLILAHREKMVQLKKDKDK